MYIFFILTFHDGIWMHWVFFVLQTQACERTHVYTRTHTSDRVWMRGDAFRNVFYSIQDQSNLVFNDAVSLKNSVCGRWMSDYEVFVEWRWEGKTENIVGKHVSGSHFPSQIPHGPTWLWNRASAVRGRRLIAWAMAWTLLIQIWLDIRKKILFTRVWEGLSRRDFSSVNLYLL